jgi:hypothetical protein
MTTETQEASTGTKETIPPPAATPPEPAAGSWREYFARAGALAKEHPTAVIVVTAAAGVLFAAEFTVGALTGVGAALLLGKKTGPELREQIKRRSEELLQRTREQGQRLYEEGKRRGEQILRRGRAPAPPRDKRQQPPPAAGTPTQQSV